jgi:hypothetical protein
MLEIGKSSERNHFTSNATTEIARGPKKPTIRKSILPNCNVSFEQSMCCLGFAKSTDFIEQLENMYFENRKRRPQERGRKKRRKGKYDPIDRLWNSSNSEKCGVGQFLEQD